MVFIFHLCPICLRERVVNIFVTDTSTVLFWMTHSCSNFNVANSYSFSKTFLGTNSAYLLLLLIVLKLLHIYLCQIHTCATLRMGYIVKLYLVTAYKMHFTASLALFPDTFLSGSSTVKLWNAPNKNITSTAKENVTWLNSG